MSCKSYLSNLHHQKIQKYWLYLLVSLLACDFYGYIFFHFTTVCYELRGGGMGKVVPHGMCISLTLLSKTFLT